MAVTLTCDTTVEPRNLEVPGTCKHTSRYPEIDPSESVFLHDISIEISYAQEMQVHVWVNITPY